MSAFDCKPGDEEVQAANALECHLVSDLSTNGDAGYLSGNLWGEKGVAGSHFKAFVWFFFMFKSQLWGMRVLIPNSFAKLITETPRAPAVWPALCHACWGFEGGGGQRARHCPQEPYTPVGSWDIRRHLLHEAGLCYPE